jgi:hypothetical protein
MRRVFFVLVFLFLHGYYIGCKSDNSDAEKNFNTALFLIQNSEIDSDVRNACLKYAISEYACVRESEDGEFQICTKKSIDAHQKSLTENSRGRANIREWYSCMESCNREYHLAIRCPSERTYDTYREYARVKRESEDLFQIRWRECENTCLITK